MKQLEGLNNIHEMSSNIFLVVNIAFNVHAYKSIIYSSK